MCGNARRRFITLLLSFVITALLPAGLFAAPHDTEPLRVGTDGCYPPFSYVDEDGTLQGFDVDIATALCKELDRTCEFVVSQWPQIIDELNAGKFDMIVASMNKTPEREEQVAFTRRYYRARSGFIGDADLPKDVIINSTRGILGKRVAVMGDTVHHQYLLDTYQGALTVVAKPDISDAYLLLAAGDVDFVLAENLMHLHFLNSPAGQGFDFVGDSLPADTLASVAYIAVRKGEDALRKALNRGIERLWLSGMYERINEKYFPFSIY